MKKLLSATAICVALTLLALPLAYAQEKAAPADKVFEGQLTKVDADAKVISVKGANSEMTFDYTEATQVTGPQKNVQGLAGSTGAALKITYRDAGGKHIATKIEMEEKK